ncbi:hypothetical protein TNCV_1812591 [Trichonephila clavipes]|uniref:Uncharacterized protein n=1 Tax=Trichonephila clavipes TaxID=2585209 RepID=A0A8X6W7N5_TRICX|nr:hypothetical protein TNCV_1812591 [Trichonephila clavipes]
MDTPELVVEPIFNSSFWTSLSSKIAVPSELSGVDRKCGTHTRDNQLTLADGAEKYNFSCREEIPHFPNFYTLTDGTHKILVSLVERKSLTSNFHTALTGGPTESTALVERKIRSSWMSTFSKICNPFSTKQRLVKLSTVIRSSYKLGLQTQVLRCLALTHGFL